MTNTFTLEHVQNLQRIVTIPAQAFINGRKVNALSGETFACISPIDGKTLGQVAATDAADVDVAVAAARKAFESGVWSRMAPRVRKQILGKFGDLIASHAQELALLETLDVGKPIAQSLAVDVGSTVNCIHWFAETIDKVYDEIAPTPANSLAMITREPVGVVGAIVPWNFPMIMAAWKIAPALAAGNSVVLKPSEKSPLTAIRLGELAAEAGLPEGVFNVVPGFGHTAGKALALHMDVDCLAFTGSTATGKAMLRYSGESNMKRVWLECGGKSPNIVMADAPDLEVAAQAAAAAIFYNQGEMCSAGSRLLVQRSIKDEFVARVAAIARDYAPGNPLDPATHMGAIVDDIQLKRVLDYIQIGQTDGAKLHAGGKQVKQDTGGYYIEPTLFDDVRPGMRIAEEEIFGPVLSVISFDDADEAIRIGNHATYGLASAVWSRDLNTVRKISQGLRAGLVYVNCYDADDITVPFGGFRQSGNGRDKSLHALDKYTELKTTWIQF